jgi:hypothetical protein
MSASLEAAARFPRVAFEARRPAPTIEPLRTDVAGAIVRCARGPVAAGSTAQREDAAVRVEGWRDFERVFGTTDGTSLSPYAVRGYFANGGQVLWVVRVARDAKTAEARLVLADGNAVGLFGSWPAGQPAIRAREFLVSASSPGRWANGLQVSLKLRRGGTPAGRDLADVRVTKRGETVERLMALDPARVAEDVARLSSYVRFTVSSVAQSVSTSADRELVVETTLAGGADDAPTFVEYERAATALVDEPEPAILFAPDAWTDLAPDGAPAPVLRFYRMWADLSARAMDRVVLVDPPADAAGHTLREQADALRDAPADEAPDPRAPSAGALYYPRLIIPDPAASALNPTRIVPPSGHVAGVISRIDRERGAYHTPANAEIVEAVDLERDYDDAERAVLNQEGVNALRCARGRGVEVWGGRTLHRDSQRRFLAHRRLIHRLVRAMRRVAEPLVFDANTPTLRFTLVRAITTVLLEAFRAGALKGSRPEEAFQVVCDDTTNPPDAYDTGHCIAEVALAPAVPMEFILLTVSLSRDGSLEVLE